MCELKCFVTDFFCLLPQLLKASDICFFCYLVSLNNSVLFCFRRHCSGDQNTAKGKQSDSVPLQFWKSSVLVHFPPQRKLQQLNPFLFCRFFLIDISIK